MGGRTRNVPHTLPFGPALYLPSSTPFPPPSSGSNPCSRPSCFANVCQRPPSRSSVASPSYPRRVGVGACSRSRPLDRMMPPSPLFQGTLPASFRILWRPPHFEAPGRERANMGFLLRGRACDRGTPLENKFGPGRERKYNSIARGGGERASQRGVETAPVPA